jgi:hypothetical protein
VQYTKELSAVIAKTNAKGALVGQIGLGGNPNAFITLVPFDSFDDIGKFPEAMAKALVGTWMNSWIGDMGPGTVPWPAAQKKK